ncbi:hypothetical protein CISIN_1g044817mg [Citrus sinensis]|uniref:Uncharacterized protein n=1 Tax=Citrus sinensis TaxID=2711 RepID=A0A067DZL5_CITSI|nr:hypothetical protein CISIN_1g044817mg [Citrus sinensis]
MRNTHHRLSRSGGPDKRHTINNVSSAAVHTFLTIHWFTQDGENENIFRSSSLSAIRLAIGISIKRPSFGCLDISVLTGGEADQAAQLVPQGGCQRGRRPSIGSVVGRNGEEDRREAD